MDFGLKDRIALVTGASSGLGFACAEQLQAEGARIVVSGSHEGRIRAARDRLNKAGPEPMGLVLDLTRPQDPAEAVAAIREGFGAPPTLVAISTGGPPGGTFDALADDAWERGLDLLLRGLVRTIRACLPGMREARHGRIVVVTSVAAREPIDALLVSSALRAGVHGLVNALAREIGGDGITINAVMPGYTRTRRLLELADRWASQRGKTRDEILQELAAGIPIGRIVEPAEVASAVAFLCSHQAAAITGTALAIDGGSLHSI